MSYLEGRLRRGGDAADHTGYVLEVEIEMSDIADAAEVVDEQLAITGNVEIADFPERGKILVFKATSIAVLEEEDDDEEG